MTTLLLILMAVSLIAALERNDRRQSLRAPGIQGSRDHDDRDWARISLDLIALGDETPTTTEAPTTAATASRDRRTSLVHRNVA
jgi:hypothetical protein